MTELGSKKVNLCLTLSSLLGFLSDDVFRWWKVCYMLTRQGQKCHRPSFQEGSCYSSFCRSIQVKEQASLHRSRVPAVKLIVTLDFVCVSSSSGPKTVILPLPSGDTYSLNLTLRGRFSNLVSRLHTSSSNCMVLKQVEKLWQHLSLCATGITTLQSSLLLLCTLAERTSSWHVSSVPTCVFPCCRQNALQALSS